MTTLNREMLDFIRRSPTAWHAVAEAQAKLIENGYTPLSESEKWEIEPGKGYFVTRNGSSLVAFFVPREDFCGWMAAAAHTDSPAFKIKENATFGDGLYTRLSVEKYGGMLCASWLDRPLSAAGRVGVRTDAGVKMRLVDLKDPCAIIPHLAIHMDRKANDNASYNPAVDMVPIAGVDGEELRRRVAEAAGAEPEDLLSTDLFLYPAEDGTEWDGYLTSPRLDDLSCVYPLLSGFLAASPREACPVLCLFDNEEVGSQTKQGAASTFLSDVLARMCDARGIGPSERREKLARSFLISADNAHAVHPNHPEYADKHHAPTMGGGIVIKYNANQRYATDAVSAAVMQLFCERAGVPWQRYANRADLPGGSTLGSIADTAVSVPTVDIGLAQLAMHSASETMGAEDPAYLEKVAQLYFSSSLSIAGEEVRIV